MTEATHGTGAPHLDRAIVHAIAGWALSNKIYPRSSDVASTMSCLQVAGVSEEVRGVVELLVTRMKAELLVELSEMLLWPLHYGDDDEQADLTREDDDDDRCGEVIEERRR